MSQTSCGPRDAVDEIEISSPCTVPWDGMRRTRGDERVRFCGQCKQNVYNVEALGRGEARRLIAAREGRVCVRILRRPDGTVVTADCWARLRAARRRGLLPFLGTLVLVGFAELGAIGAGLARLRALIGGPPAPPPRLSLPVVGQAPRPAQPLVPTMGAPPPVPEKRHYLMGKRAVAPVKLEDLL
ncbi:MAG TPA: hypothetical protein VHO06_21670 [Polyangia bacterium]|nr:hypothetical protein [Polyangia bacterium]